MSGAEKAGGTGEPIYAALVRELGDVLAQSGVGGPGSERDGGPASDGPPRAAGSPPAGP